MDEFGNVSMPKPKRQTIRAVGKRRHARPGEIVQLYHGMRTKQCFKIGDGRCKAVYKIEFDIKDVMMVKLHDEPWREVDDRFAQLDGFSDYSDMCQFWINEHGPCAFSGVLIEWEPL
jgi:hypothetical protein